MAWSEHLGTSRGRAPLHAGALYALDLCVIGVGYFALAKIGLMLASINPSAIAGLACDRTGIRGSSAARLPGLASDPGWSIRRQRLTTAGSIGTSLGISAGNTVEALLGAYLINRLSDGKATFESPAGVARFALLSLPADRAVREHRRHQPCAGRSGRPARGRPGLADLVAR